MIFTDIKFIVKSTKMSGTQMFICVFFSMWRWLYC